MEKTIMTLYYTMLGDRQYSIYKYWKLNELSEPICVKYFHSFSDNNKVNTKRKEWEKINGIESVNDVLFITAINDTEVYKHFKLIKDLNNLKIKE